MGFFCPEEEDGYGVEEAVAIWGAMVEGYVFVDGVEGKVGE
jgi:hypothetical protein